MVQVRCPQCSSLVEGIEGQEAVCGQCGFRALLPVPSAATLSPTPSVGGQAPSTHPPPAPVPASKATQAPPAPPPSGGAMLAIWGYILGIAALATFFMASVGLPFAF